MTAEYPHRLRLAGGRNTHAARVITSPTGATALVTACGYTDSSRDHPMTDTAPVTCRNCARLTPATS